MKRSIAAFFFLFTSLSGTSLLESMQAYARTIPEFPAITNNNWFDPEFADQPSGSAAWYHYIKPAIKNIFSLQKFWSTKAFLQALEQQHTLRQQTPNVFITAQPDNYFVVWGDLYGSFHALVNALTFWHKEGVIDENLHIIKPQFYFIFLGNVIDRASRSFETLFVILLLLNANPDHVFYLQGQEEHNGYWHSFGLNREIQQKFTWNVNKINTIRSKLDLFFSTLPQALFISLSQDIALECTYNPDDRLLEPYFEKTKKGKETIRSVIQGQGDIPLKIPEPDLELLPFLESNTTYWKVFSAYNALFKQEQVRTAASFAVIHIQKNMAESVITNYKAEKNTFIPQENRILLTGEYESVFKKIQQAARPIVTVGSTLDLSGELGPVGREFSTGLQTTFLFYNREPQSKFLIKHYILNDLGKVHNARENIQTLITKYHSDLIVSPVGDHTVPVFAQSLKVQHIPLLFPVSGSSLLRDKELSNIVNFEPSYQEEIRVLIEYIIKHLDAERYALIYFLEHEDTQMLNAAHEVLNKHKLTSIDIRYADKTVDLKKQIEKLKDFGPDALGFIGSPAEIRACIADLGIDYLFNKICFFPSIAAHESFKEYMHKIGVQSIFANAMPHPEKSELEIVKEYRALMKKAESPLSTTVSYLIDAHSLQSYIAATLFLDALDKLDASFDTKKLLTIFEQYHDYHYKGLTLTFNPQTRSLSQPVWLEYDYQADWIPLFPSL